MCLINSVLALAGPVIRTAPDPEGLKVVLVLLRMATPDRVGLVVDVLRWVVWIQHQSIHICRAQMENAGFTVIDPNDRMIMVAVHRIKPRPVAR
jgi:hypothetical protein